MLAEMSARAGIRFYTPETVVEVDLPGINAICDELRKIEITTNPPRPGVTRLLDELELHVVEFDLSGPMFTPDDRQRAILLRAIDHLRNFGGQGDVLIKLRDKLCGERKSEPIGYGLHSVKGGPTSDFTSYSDAYNVGDRLVYPGGSEYRIVDNFDGNPLEFLVEEWRPAE
jgi:hypothetical protein